MAIKDLLFHLDPDGAQAPGSEFAVSFAAAHGAHLTAASVAIQYPPQFASPASFAGGLEFNAVESFAQLGEENRKAASDAFERLAKSLSAGVLAESMMIETFPHLVGEEFGRLARGFDLAIITQPRPGGPDYAQDIVTGALFGSGRPVFVLPSSFTGPAKLTKAMVCWDGGAPAAKALAEFFPFWREPTKSKSFACRTGTSRPSVRPALRSFATSNGTASRAPCAKSRRRRTRARRFSHARPRAAPTSS